MSISGRKVMINPVGGLYHHKDKELDRWIFQRDYINGVVPDTLVMDYATPLADMLEMVGANVYSTRNLDKFTTGIGESNQQKWSECCSLHLKSKKLPSPVWDTGETALQKDINARVNYAEYLKVDCIVSLNFSISTEQGVEFLYNNPDAKRLAESIRDNMIRTNKKHIKEKFMREDTDETHPVVSKTQIPSVEISIFNLQNASEGWLAGQWWAKIKVATGIFGGVYKIFE